MAAEGTAQTGDEWPSDASGYERQQTIGRGAFATVWKMHCPSMGCDVAVKILDLEAVTSSFEEIRQEVMTMKMTRHPNVLQCHASFVHESSLWLVSPLMNMGSALHILNASKHKGLGEGLREDWVAAILKETLQGLNYFHSNGQIHRDLKAGNILLDSEGSVRIADFGVAGWLMEAGDRRQKCNTFVGTPCWMAPEVMEQSSGYDDKADIWSFGITALELAKGFAPYAHYQPMKVLLLTLQNDPPSLASYEDPRREGVAFSRSFQDMVRNCLMRDPTSRPTAAQLLTHKFFKKAPSTESLVAELLSQLDDIADGGADIDGEPLPGVLPLYGREVDADEAAAGAAAEAAAGTEEGESKYVPGTTWVFESSVVTSNREPIDDQDFEAAFNNAISSSE